MNYGWNILLDPESDAGGGTPSSVSEQVDSVASADASASNGVAAAMMELPRAEYDQMRSQISSAEGNNAFFERVRGAGIEELNSISNADLKMIHALQGHGFTDHEPIVEALYGRPATAEAGVQSESFSRQEAEQMLEQRFAQRDIRDNLNSEYQTAFGLQESAIKTLRNDLGLAHEFSEIPSEDMLGQLMHHAMNGYRMTSASGLIDNENHPMNGRLVPFGDEESKAMGEFFRNAKEKLSAQVQFQLAKKVGADMPTGGKDKVSLGGETKPDPSSMSDEDLKQAQRDEIEGFLNKRRKARGGQPTSQT